MTVLVPLLGFDQQGKIPVLTADEAKQLLDAIVPPDVQQRLAAAKDGCSCTKVRKLS